MGNRNYIRNNVIGAFLALLLLGASGAGGYAYLKLGLKFQAPASGKSDTTATVKDTLAIKPELLTDARVRLNVNGSINEGYIDDDGKVIRLYQLSPSALTKALELGFKKHEDSVDALADLHKTFFELTKGKDAPAIVWDSFTKQNATMPELYDRLAEINVNENARADFKNVAALLRIGRERKDALAVTYAHRILHDLDEWVYHPDLARAPGDDAKYGAARTYAKPPKSQVAEIEAYIAKNRKT